MKKGFTKEEFLKFAQDIKYAYGISDEDFSQYTKARQAITKDSMIKKYGEEKGLEKDIQDIVNEYNKKVEAMLKEKEEELLTV